jgi:hypothetical protein
MNFQIPENSERVFMNTSKEVNDRIRRQMEVNISYYSKHKDKIDQRLRDLDREWNIERVLQTNASVFALSGLIMGVFRKNWFLLPGIVAGFLLQQSIQGWCPPVSVLRRLGFRTSKEIDQERYALKALRGDFKDINPDMDEDAFVKADKLMRSVDANGKPVPADQFGENI